MFRKVLADVDGHLGGRDAVTLAAQPAPGDGTLSLAHVYPVRRSASPRLRRLRSRPVRARTARCSSAT
jgi:hypothetical protein